MPDRTVTYNFKGNFANLGAGLATMGKGVQDLGVKLTALDKNGVKMRAGLTQIGSTAGKVGLIAAAGFAVAVGAAAKFDSAMSRAGAATRATAGELEELRGAALKAGADTVFSASEAADGITELGKAGLSTSDILGGALTGALNLAAAGQISVAEAAGTTAITLQQYGLEGAKASHVSDVLAAGAGKAMGSVTDMAAALKYVGPVAAQMGISLEESAGAIAELASQGVIGEQAGTSLRGMLTSLTSPSKLAADEMQALGISLYDTSGQFVGLDGVAQQLQDSMGGLSAAERDQALGRIFGNEQITAARILYAGGAGDVQKWTAAVDDSGYAADQAAQLTDNLAGDIEQLKGSLETAFIGAGDGSQGPIRKLVQGLTDATNAFNDLPGPAKNAASSLLGITAIVGGGLWFTAKVVGGIANTKQALSDLGFTADRASGSLGRVARTAAGITAVAGAVTILGNELAKATGAKIDASDLQRNLESVANGENSELIKRITSDVDVLGQTLDKSVEPFYEFSTAFGFFGNTARDNASDNIRQVDEALANMVESGNAEQAAAAFAQIAASITGLPAGSSFNPAFIDGFDSYATALTNAAAASSDAGDAAGAAKGPTDEYGVAARQAAIASDAEADALNQATDAMRKKTSATLAAFDAETGYRQALKAAQVQGKKNDEGIRGSTEAALNNRSALSSLAGAWNNQSAAVKNNEARYRQARKDFIDTATAMGVPKRAAEDLAKRLLEIPKKVVSKVTVDNSQANKAITSTGDMLSRLDGKVARTYIDTIQRGYSIKRDNMNTSADGGSVPKDGGPYADRHLYMLAPGEEIISNRHGQADAFRRDRAAGAIPGYANGGTIGGGFNYARTGAGGTPMFALVGAANAAADSLGNLAGLGKKELEIRTKLLQKEVDRDKQRAEALKQEWDSIRSAVADRFRSDPFARSESSFTLDGPEGGPTTAAQSMQWALAQQQVNAFQNQGQSPADILKADIKAAREMRRLLREAKQAGINGNALATLAQGADADQIRALLADPKLAHQYDNLYDTRQQVTGSLGRDAANLVLGKQLAHANAIAAASNAALREANKRLHHLEKLAEKNPQETGKHTGKNLGSTVGAAARRR